MARVLLPLTGALCCLALALPSPGAAQGADGVVYAAAPQERGAYHVGAAGGTGHYGYNTGDGIAKVEVRREDGSVVGSYRYFDPNGKQIVRTYIADDKGFRVLGNDLPISLDTPAAKVEGAPALTGAVEGTQDYAIPPPLSPGSARVVQPGTVTQSLSEQYALTQQGPVAQKLVQQQVAPAGASAPQLAELQAQQLREQQELQAKQIQQMQELQAKLIAQQQINIQKQADTISLQQATYGGPVNNDLTGGYTSPYYVYPEKLPFDFPAGFAYPGMPIIRQPDPEPVTTPHPYIIGKRDPVQTPELTTSTTTTTTTTSTTTTTTPSPPLAGDDPDHPDIDITSGHSHSEVSTHSPVAPQKGDDPDHPEVEISSGHTHSEVSTHPPIAPPLKEFRPVDDKVNHRPTCKPIHQCWHHTHQCCLTHPHHTPAGTYSTSTENSTSTKPTPTPSVTLVTVGHAHTDIVEPEPIVPLQHVNHVEGNPIPPRDDSYHTVPQINPIAIYDPNPISKRPLWNYNDYPFNRRPTYNTIQRPVVHQDPNPISKRPLWNYSQYPYVRPQSYERIRPIAGRPRLPHCPGWCP